MISWYLNITPNRMFSQYNYPIQDKDGPSLCEEHGDKLEMLEVVIFDREAIELSPPDPSRKPLSLYRGWACFRPPLVCKSIHDRL